MTSEEVGRLWRRTRRVRLLDLVARVGLGGGPPTELGRRYADELGRANQIVAAAADDAYFMAAGLPLNLKALSRE